MINIMHKPRISGRTINKRAVGLLASLLFIGNILGANAQEQHPNIILFLVDDMGLMDVSVPMLTDAEGKPEVHPLNEWYRTPHLERFAEKGIRFSNFYAHSVCSPSRNSILTGQNSARHGTTQWVLPYHKNGDEFAPPAWNWEGLKGDEPTLPRLLRNKGYRTIHVGKGHLAPFGQPGSDPSNLGFDVNIGGSPIGQPGSYYGEDNYRRHDPSGLGRTLAVPHLEKYHGTDTYLTEALTLEAKEQIADAAAQGKPFFLHMSHYAVHTPFQPDLRFIENYSDEGKSNGALAYASMVEGVDKSLGDLIDQVERLGLAENTLIIFLGDNGSASPLGSAHGHTSSAPLRGKKATHWEGGTRVPFVASWVKPDDGNSIQRRLPILSGQIQTQMGSIMDLMPTLLNLVGADIPDSHIVDGVDLRTQLEGKKNPERPNFFINHFPHWHQSSYYTSYVKGDWKLIYFYPTEEAVEPMLFKISEDPYENNNLAEDRPEQLNLMIDALRGELNRYGALYPVSQGLR